LKKQLKEAGRVLIGDGLVDPQFGTICWIRDGKYYVECDPDYRGRSRYSWYVASELTPLTPVGEKTIKSVREISDSD
jgi:hypothetical protein